uniref:Uncharacterized protein n=1 Tax=Arundo donax TaxID=35708 RepID=A0A0A9G3U6_ARUDO
MPPSAALPAAHQQENSPQPKQKRIEEDPGDIKSALRALTRKGPVRTHTL